MVVVRMLAVVVAGRCGRTPVTAPTCNEAERDDALSFLDIHTDDALAYPCFA